MTFLPPDIDMGLLAAALAITLCAGVVKGMVGFAMPMIMISLLGSFLPPELALAALILPTLASNGVQALREGPSAAGRAVREFRVFLGVGLMALFVGAQMVALLPARTVLMLIGGPILVFAVLQLAGWRPRPAPGHRTRIEVIIGAIAGFTGGMSGVWGPPTVMLLTALDTPKAAQMRIQGVIYGLGAVALTVAHVGSGVLTPQTAVFSALMIVPALAGMRLGFALSDRFDQTTFRRATLAVLLVAALNLLRRAWGM
ncbi:sulfite exporter TauE/SafE family protein [Lutimaribacter sp. EGI FJ00015]|uniref:Sulfite exporter TauE/SafE family protein n=1 Tax=Lutimaribacter degradans TaxID=2945989 RepID=A0ACC5ZZY4_9RHOB|nr:sulfite exporter TauE/SafE family protein [Lutimaribacter sp. EGI FJ00013]MCM2563478.1 sulfite exporter TauE/SafE family protein [Lutimaribacter sp. EGI FJ00013]MCO0614658.1 sulfite exporter TauE/SafE family protein [Lutimaribacter sp. EGI FJ00015]MCO0637329.1 sulfite exporter TauE/SafE family protein [Lutimaribacter sp. EGI FJ00014]